MKNRLWIILTSVFLFSCSDQEAIKSIIEIPKLSIDSFIVSGTVIRAMDTDSSNNVYFAGSGGKWGIMDPQGEFIVLDSIMLMDSVKPDFRSVFLKDTNLFMLSVANPAALIKINLLTNTWNLVYEDTTKNAFFDMVAFNEKGHGFILGDPLYGCFNLVLSNDGSTWTKVDCNNIPSALENEAPFAASNTNVEFKGEHIWFVTGGKSSSRVYRSTNTGKTWDVSETPIVSGQVMTGIYSVDFYDKNIGIIAGGNWDSVPEVTPNLAITKDGGKNWKLITHNLPYISCVQFIPGSEGNNALLLSGRARGGETSMHYFDVVNDTTYAYSNDNYLSIKFTNDSTAWLGGKNKLGLLRLKK